MPPPRGLLILPTGVRLTASDADTVQQTKDRAEIEALIPHGRCINFVAEFLAADKGVTRAEAIAAWTERAS